jgi:hypothetical protein
MHSNLIEVLSFTLGLGSPLLMQYSSNCMGARGHYCTGAKKDQKFRKLIIVFQYYEYKSVVSL